MPSPTDLRVRIQRDFYLRSAFNRGRLDRSGLGRFGLRAFEDLQQLAPMSLDDVEFLDTLLLAPAPPTKQRLPLGPPSIDAGVSAWNQAGRLPMAYSKADLKKLRDQGEEILLGAGLSESDSVVSCFGPLEQRARWQLGGGVEKLGATLFDFAPGTAVAALDTLRPTVVIAGLHELARIYSEKAAMLSRVHTVLVVGELADYELAALRQAAAPAAMVRAWSPLGTFGLWGQCRGGNGFHTFPDDEIVEVVDPLSGRGRPKGSPRPGRLLWTGLGWLASSVLRLDTGRNVAAITEDCTFCGRDSTRLFLTQGEWSFANALDESPHVSSWYAELQLLNKDPHLNLCVASLDVTDSSHVLALIDKEVGPATVQLMSEVEVQQRIESANGERFVDRRAD